MGILLKGDGCQLVYEIYRINDADYKLVNYYWLDKYFLIRVEKLKRALVGCDYKLVSIYDEKKDII